MKCYHQKRGLVSRVRSRRFTNEARPGSNIAEELNAVNRASETVSTFYLVLLGLCAYTFLVVVGTSDLDLLIGKSVRLPGVTLDVSLIAFFVVAPIMLILVHVNLLAKLFLLAGKLYGCQRAIAKEKDGEAILLQHLSIFPFNHYLIGSAHSPITTILSALVVATILVIPIATLLAIQLRFLAYQSESITWLHRIFVWLDVFFIVRLWPCIVHHAGDRSAYVSGLWLAVRRRYGRTLVQGIVLSGVLMLLFCRSSLTWLFLVAFLLSLGAIYVLAMLFVWLVRQAVQMNRSPGSDAPKAHRASECPTIPGAGALVAVAIIGISVPLAAAIDGERWETLVVERVVPAFPSWSDAIMHYVTTHLSKNWVSTLQPLHNADKEEDAIPLWVKVNRINNPPLSRKIAMGEISIREVPTSVPTTAFNRGPLGSFRHLVLNDQVLVGDHPRPEIIETLRTGNRSDTLRISKGVQPIDLSNRNLRGAQLKRAILVRAILQETDLRRADLSGAHMREAQLIKTNLSQAVLAGADLMDSKIYAANFSGALLDHSHFDHTVIDRSDFIETHATFVSFNNSWVVRTRFDGADLFAAELYGSSIEDSSFNGASLGSAIIGGGQYSNIYAYGANLHYVGIYGTHMSHIEFGGANLQDARVYGSQITDSRFDGSDLRDADMYGLYIGELPPNSGGGRFGSVSSRDPVTGEIIEHTRKSSFLLVRTNGSRWMPLNPKEFHRVSKHMVDVIDKEEERTAAFDLLKQARVAGQKAPVLGSCLDEFKAKTNESELTCQFRQDPTTADMYSKMLHSYLERLACESVYIARGIYFGGTPYNIKKQIFSRRGDPRCVGVYNLTDEEKRALNEF